MRAARGVIAAILILFCLAAPAVAHAAPAGWAPAIPTGTDCLRPPTPASPTGGGSGWLDPGPANPIEGDPFAPDSGATLYDVYGYGGYEAIIFDPGCLDQSRLFDADNALANINTTVSTMLISLSARAVRVITDGSFGSLWEPLQKEGQRIFGAGIFIPLAFVGLVVTGLVILSRSRKGDVSWAARVTGGAAAILLAGLACATYAVTVGAVVDSAIGQSFKAANEIAARTISNDDRDPADAFAGNLIKQTLYPSWQQQTFGGSGQAAAEEFGPALFAAGAFTRAEQARIDADPSLAPSMIDAKKDEYKAVAKKVEEKYPVAYQHLAGNHTLERAQFAIMSTLSVVVSVAYLLYCLARIAWASVVARVGVGFAPAVALVAQVPQWQHIAVALVSWVGMALVRAGVYSFVFVVYLAGVMGGIMSPALDVHPAVKVVFIIMSVFAMQMLLRKLGFQTSIRDTIAAKRRGRDAKEERRANPTAAAEADRAAVERVGAQAPAAYARFGQARPSAFDGQAATRPAASRPVVWATRTVGEKMLTSGATRAAAASTTAGSSVGAVAARGVAARAALATPAAPVAAAAVAGQLVTRHTAGRAMQTRTAAASVPGAARSPLAATIVTRPRPAPVTVTSLPAPPAGATRPVLPPPRLYRAAIAAPPTTRA